MSGAFGVEGGFAAPGTGGFTAPGAGTGGFTAPGAGTGGFTIGGAVAGSKPPSSRIEATFGRAGGEGETGIGNPSSASVGCGDAGGFGGDGDATDFMGTAGGTVATGLVGSAVPPVRTVTVTVPTVRL
jgi:hypothetical protein